MQTTQNDVLERVRFIAYNYCKNVSNFCESTGLKQPTIASMFARNSYPSYEMLVTILTSFPDISSDWLLLGKGEMLRSANNMSQSVNVGGNVGGDVTQVMSSHDDGFLKKRLARLKLMMRGCPTSEEQDLIIEEIDDILNEK